MDFSLNISKSQTSIEVVGDLVISSSMDMIQLTGSFASFLKVFVLQGQNLVQKPIGGRNLTNVELNLHQESSTVMTGIVKIDDETCHLNFLKRIKGIYTYNMSLIQRKNFLTFYYLVFFLKKVLSFHTKQVTKMLTTSVLKVIISVKISLINYWRFIEML